jgi:hypothetical protein
VVSAQGFKIAIQKHRERHLADRPSAAADTPAQSVLVAAIEDLKRED